MSDVPLGLRDDALSEVADWGPPEDWSDWLDPPDRRGGPESVED